MQIWTLSDAKQDFTGFTLVAQKYSRDVCYYNFCVCVRACVCARSHASIYISRSEANICPPQHSWDVMSPAFIQDKLLSTHSLPTDGCPLSTSRLTVAHANTQLQCTFWIFIYLFIFTMHLCTIWLHSDVLLLTKFVNIQLNSRMHKSTCKNVDLYLVLLWAK